jgi:hypothetical protein
MQKPSSRWNLQNGVVFTVATEWIVDNQEVGPANGVAVEQRGRAGAVYDHWTGGRAEQIDVYADQQRDDEDSKCAAHIAPSKRTFEAAQASAREDARGRGMSRPVRLKMHAAQAA